MTTPDEPVRLADVARAADVSLTTASRALSSRSHRVAPASRERVLAAADRLGYQRVRRTTTATGTRRVALLAGELSLAPVAEISGGVIDQAVETGHLVTVTGDDRVYTISPDPIARLLRRPPHAAILVGSWQTADEAAVVDGLRELEATGCRVVLVTGGGLPFDTVAVAHEDAAYELASLVLAHAGDAREIAILAGPARLPSSRLRSQGFRRALGDHGLAVAPAAVVHSDLNRDGGYAAAGELLSRLRPPDLVLAVGDEIALGAIARLREAGLAVPDDVLVTGFDGIAHLRNVSPPLITYALPLAEIGRHAMQLAGLPRMAEPRLVWLTGEVRRGDGRWRPA